MYKEIIADIDKQIEDLKAQVMKINKQIEVRTKAREAIVALQAEEDRKAGNLAVQKGICPFPTLCNERNYCTKNACNADTCSNGYAYRMS